MIQAGLDVSDEPAEARRAASPPPCLRAAALGRARRRRLTLTPSGYAGLGVAIAGQLDCAWGVPRVPVHSTDHRRQAEHPSGSSWTAGRSGSGPSASSARFRATSIPGNFAAIAAGPGRVAYPPM